MWVGFSPYFYQGVKESVSYIVQLVHCTGKHFLKLETDPIRIINDL